MQENLFKLILIKLRFKKTDENDKEIKKVAFSKTSIGDAKF